MFGIEIHENAKNSLSLMEKAKILSQFFPSITPWLDSRYGGSVATHMVQMGSKISGCTDLESMVQCFKEDAEILKNFQEAMAHLVAILEIFTNPKPGRLHNRDRDIEMMLEAHHTNLRADVMVVSAALGLIICLLTLVGYQNHLPGEAVGIISTVAGIFGACLKDAYAFEFGSSRGSKNKDMASVILGRG